MKAYKNPKSGNINAELEKYRRKRAARMEKTPSFLKKLYEFPNHDKKED